MANNTSSSSYDSESEEDDMLLFLASQLSKKRKRRHWVHSTLQKRKQLGEFHTLINELDADAERFKQYFRVSREQFEIILSNIQEDITKQTTYWREPIGARERLAICLR